jgi:hypothetical protein
MDIYEQHRKAFAKVAAYVILRDGERVATVAFKYPADGAGRLWAYVHWIGLPMVRGSASGGGYDKATAACAAAARVMCLDNYTQPGYGDFRHAMALDGGQHWGGALREAGFTVLQAV